MKRWIPGMVFLLISSGSLAGDSTRKSPADTAKAVITVKKDLRLDILNRKQTLINKSGSLKPHLVRESGYRLQLISTQDRAIALSMKTSLLTRFPGQQTYLLYQAPLFRIRIGNFRTRQEALAFRNGQLAHISEVFVVRDIIEYMWYPPVQDE